MDIVDALRSLDPANDDHWTAEGAPSLSVVSGLVGSTVSRKAATNAAPGLTRDCGTAFWEEFAVKAKAPADEHELDFGNGEDDGGLALAQSAYEDAAKKAAGLREIADKAAAEALKAQATADRIQEGLDAATRDPHKGTNDIREYLARQAEQRTARAEARAAMLKGIDPTLILARSPIDNAFAHKRGRGGKRPTIPARQG
jgi:hypothetical protein